MTQTVPLFWARAPLTKNQVRRTHHYAHSAIINAAMDEARWAIRAARVTPIRGLASVRLHWRPGTRRLADSDGLYPTLSICLDALVKEHVLVDDSWAYVRRTGVEVYEPMPGLPAAFWLEVEELQEADDAA